MNLPDQIKKFVDKFSKLPSIGPRQATRLAFYIINEGKNEIAETVEALEGLEKMSVCKNCFFVFSGDGEICDICADNKRNPKIIALVEKETDLISLEKTGKFNGKYFIIGSLSKRGMLNAEQKNRLKKLRTYIEKELGGKAEEIIIAMNQTTYGDFNTALLAKEIETHTQKITRLGRGIPTGGEIEFADEETLGSALERRI